jgi:hypothetical protein
MTYIPSFLLAGVIAYAISGPSHSALGTPLGALVDLIVFLLVFYFTNRILRKLKDG